MLNMSTQTNSPVNQSLADALSRSKQEPAWLTALRTEAAEAAQTLEWPKPEKNEYYPLEPGRIRAT